MMKTNKHNKDYAHSVWQGENQTRYDDRSIHHINKISRCQHKEKQEKSKDIFSINTQFDNFFSKLLH